MTIQVDDRALQLLKDRPTREAVEDLGRKAASVDGLDRLLIGDRDDEELQVSLDRHEFPSLNVPKDDETPEPEVSHRETWLQIISLHFRDGYKWRFSDGGERPFTAVMEDEAFQRRVQDADVSLTANDAIKCCLREEQIISGGGLTKSRNDEVEQFERPTRVSSGIVGHVPDEVWILEERDWLLVDRRKRAAMGDLLAQIVWATPPSAGLLRSRVSEGARKGRTKNKQRPTR